MTNRHGSQNPILMINKGRFIVRWARLALFLSGKR
jgi:hypothetical protein